MRRKIKKEKEKELEAARQEREDRKNAEQKDREERTQISRDRLALQRADREAQKQKAKDRAEDAKQARLKQIRQKRVDTAKKTMQGLKTAGIRNIQKIDKEMGDGTATRKMLDNLGQVGAGVARVAGRTALGTAQSVAAAPGAIKMAAKQRKDDVESGVSRRLGSRAGLRKDDPKTKESRDERARKQGIRQRALSIKKAGEVKRERQEKGRQDKERQTKEPVVQQKALPAARDTKALPPSREVKALPAARDIKALPPARDSAGSRARRDPEEKKRMIKARGGSVTEQFLNEVENTKKDKVDKIIDIMRGKNKIEVNPKISESHLLVQDLADYKPLEFETVDIIKPKPLKASDWRSEIEESAAWTRKEGKNKSGGLNEKGRKSYERENPGSDLKAPSKKVGNKRRSSFCARMKGMKKKLTSKKTANDPNSRINKSLRAWNC